MIAMTENVSLDVIYDDLQYIKKKVEHLEQLFEANENELHVKQITDKRAIAVLSKLEKDAKEGKRKTISHAEFLAKNKHLIE